MATHSISQARVTEAAKLSCQAKLCMWLGRASSNTLSAEAVAETEVLIAAYLDGNAAAAASADAAPAEAPIPPSAAPAAPAAPAASAGAPRALPAERAQLMRRLEEHMATHSISQAQVAKAAKLSGQARISMWLGHTSSYTISAEAEAGIDAAIAAYLDGQKQPSAAPVQKKQPSEKTQPSGYMLFCQQRRPGIVAAHPSLKFGDIGKRLGMEWGQLSDAEKARYTATTEPSAASGAAASGAAASGAAASDAATSGAAPKAPLSSSSADLKRPAGGAAAGEPVAKRAASDVAPELTPAQAAGTSHGKSKAPPDSMVIDLCVSD